MSIQNRVLPIIVFSQFCCTSLWFAGNAVMGDLLESFSLESSALGHLTSAVQIGFIFGTLIIIILFNTQILSFIFPKYVEYNELLIKVSLTSL